MWRTPTCPLAGHCLPSVGLAWLSPCPSAVAQPPPGAGCSAERAAPADSLVTQGSPSLLLNRKHFSVSFPLPLELKPPFCSKTHQAKEILLPLQLTHSPPSSFSSNAHPAVPPCLGYTGLAEGQVNPTPVLPLALGDSRDRVTEGLQDSVLSTYRSYKYSQIRQKAKPALGSPPLALPEDTSLAWPASRLSPPLIG